MAALGVEITEVGFSLPLTDLTDFVDVIQTREHLIDTVIGLGIVSLKGKI